jgi:cysteine synthase B
MALPAPSVAPEPAQAAATGLLDQIGNTPLLRLGRITAGLPPGVEVLAKAEYLNPSGSLKDRSARAMILAGLAGGALTPGRIILDATSGNAGIAYAMIGAALGYRVSLCLPGNATAERKRILGIHGAAIIETDPAQGSDGARRMAGELRQADPERYFHVDQYNNDANWRAHFETTAPEIWRQTCGRITHFVAGVGTSGLFTGTARGLKRFNPAITAIEVQPDGPAHHLAGLKHMKTALVPGIYDPRLADAKLEVGTGAGQEMARRLALEEGLLVGPSSGANLVATLELARTLPPGSVVVTVLFDSGTRYLADPFWEPASD